MGCRSAVRSQMSDVSSPRRSMCPSWNRVHIHGSYSSEETWAKVAEVDARCRGSCERVAGRQGGLFVLFGKRTSPNVSVLFEFWQRWSTGQWCRAAAPAHAAAAVLPGPFATSWFPKSAATSPAVAFNGATAELLSTAAVLRPSAAILRGFVSSSTALWGSGAVQRSFSTKA